MRGEVLDLTVRLTNPYDDDAVGLVVIHPAPGQRPAALPADEEFVHLLRKAATKVQGPGTFGGCLVRSGSVDCGYDDEWWAYWGGGAGAGAGSGSGVHVV